ncbi:unnamed protein product [Soboliphyme baturini]|uniref:Transthyretin-like family protein n=1 Tax=Soboliphyme baturini TaxID=241478 RepID=A0A183J003_9BILA|nr:unnamed protein product [Soboliphyme baturini]
MKAILACFVCIVSIVFVQGKLQRVSAKGRLMCGNVPAKNIDIKLIDQDIGVDDLMSETKTNSDGRFILQGQTSEATTIDPFLKIYHRCNCRKICRRLLKMKIPSSYIASGDKRPTTIDIGTLNLEVEFHKDQRHCF